MDVATRCGLIYLHNEKPKFKNVVRFKEQQNVLYMGEFLNSRF